MSICKRTQQECKDPQACLANGCPGTLPNYTDAANARTPQQRPSTADRLRARLKRLDEIEGSYTAYLHDRIKERDWHGGWDVCVNLSEVSCERDGLLFALEALGEVP